MTYDAANGTVVLFGGVGLHDTWTWDGTNWTRPFPANSPSGRAAGAMAYDAATGNAVLFGGYAMTTRCKGPVQYFQQTWSWGT